MAEIKRLNGILSGYDPTSEFSRWAGTRDQAVHVSPELMEVLQLWDSWRARTGGALNPAAEAIGRVWKKARDDRAVAQRSGYGGSGRCGAPAAVAAGREVRAGHAVDRHAADAELLHEKLHHRTRGGCGFAHARSERRGGEYRRRSGCARHRERLRQRDGPALRCGE